MTAGIHISAKQARELKMVDAVVPKGGDLLAAAKALCKSKIGAPLPKVRTIMCREKHHATPSYTCV